MSAIFKYQACKQFMEERALKASDLAKLTGIPKTSLGYYLAGDVQPPDRKVAMIAKVLRVAVSELLDKPALVDAPEPRAEISLLLSVAEAAEMMGCSEQRIRQGIVNNDWNPSIGSAIRGTNGEKRYQFHIPRRRVEIYLGLVGVV